MALEAFILMERSVKRACGFNSNPLQEILRTWNEDLTFIGCRYWPGDGCAGTWDAVWAPGSRTGGTFREYRLIPGFTWGFELPSHHVITTPKEHSKIGYTCLI